MPEFCFVVQKRYKKMMYKAYKWLILTVEQQKRRPVKSAISIDYNQFNSLIIRWLLADAAYLHHWLSATIHFNRYNLCFDKYTECRDKCKPLYFIALHIRVVPPLLSSFVECPLSDSMYWMIGHFRRYVPERLLNAKVVVFLGFLWFTVDFYSLKGVGWWKIGHKTGYLLWNIYDSLEKMWGNRWIRWKKCNRSDLFTWKSVELYMW